MRRGRQAAHSQEAPETATETIPFSIRLSHWVISAGRHHGEQVSICRSEARAFPDHCFQLTAAPVRLAANEVDLAQPQLNLVRQAAAELRFQ